jgi:hypothetical protein
MVPWWHLPQSSICPKVAFATMAPVQTSKSDGGSTMMRTPLQVFRHENSSSLKKPRQHPARERPGLLVAKGCCASPYRLANIFTT